MKILAIIPARGGSKGIPLKNIQKLGKYPLIYYTIKSAKESKVNRIIVSTDNKEISKISMKYGAEIPFLRPKKIAQSNSSTILVIEHVVKSLKKIDYAPDIIVLLQPTSPFRTSNMINRSIEMLTSSNATSVISVMYAKKHPFQAFIQKNGLLKHFNKNHEKKFYQRQLLPEMLFETGSVYTFWTKTLENFNSIYGPKIKPMIINSEKYNLDIDSKFDLFMAEMILKNWEKYNCE